MVKYFDFSFSMSPFDLISSDLAFKNLAFAKERSVEVASPTSNLFLVAS